MQTTSRVIRAVHWRVGTRGDIVERMVVLVDVDFLVVGIDAVVVVHLVAAQFRLLALVASHFGGRRRLAIRFTVLLSRFGVVVALGGFVEAQLLLGLLAALPLHAPVLEPDLHLGLGEHERGGHFEAFRSRQVFVLAELVLQFEQLLARECSARSPGFAQ